MSEPPFDMVSGFEVGVATVPPTRPHSYAMQLGDPDVIASDFPPWRVELRPHGNGRRAVITYGGMPVCHIDGGPDLTVTVPSDSIMLTADAAG